MTKKVFYSELAYVIGIVFIALSAAILQRVDFGMSMIVALPYLLHLKISEVFPIFSFGMAEYCFQAFLIVLLAIVTRKPKWSYLFSFVTAVIYGFTLDGMVYLISLLPEWNFVVRVIMFIVGVIIVCFGVACVFNTYISPEAYELFVKEVSDKFRLPIDKVKTTYDITSCVVSVVLSFVFFGFGSFVAVNIGTFICAITNGTIIGFMSRFLTKHFEFIDGLKLRKYFEK